VRTEILLDEDHRRDPRQIWHGPEPRDGRKGEGVCGTRPGDLRISSPDIAIVGGGLCGRLLAWRIGRAGLRVALYAAASRLGEESAAWVAAGMVAPAAESVDVDAEIVSMGKHSLSLWPQWLRELPQPVFFRDTGTLLLWHREDAGEAFHFERMLAEHAPGTDLVQLDSAKLQELEPNLSARFQHSLYLPGDAQLDNREVTFSYCCGSGGNRRQVLLADSNSRGCASDRRSCRRLPRYGSTP
jgi:glycine/D-amino acid oxidase-like deaminating enzyme